MSRDYVMAGFLLACLAVALTYLTDGMWRREVPASELKVGGRYYAGKARHRVRVRAIRPGVSYFTVVLEDVDTGEVESTPPLHPSAPFEARRWGP